METCSVIPQTTPSALPAPGSSSDPTQLCWPGCHGPAVSPDPAGWSLQGARAGLCPFCGERAGLELLQVQECCQPVPSLCQSLPSPVPTQPLQPLRHCPLSQQSSLQRCWLIIVIISACQGEDRGTERGNVCWEGTEQDPGPGPQACWETSPAQQQSVFTFCSQSCSQQFTCSIL